MSKLCNTIVIDLQHILIQIFDSVNYYKKSLFLYFYFSGQ